MISDVVMPQLSGLDLLRCLKAGNPNRPVILVTAHASIDLAVESMKQGAQDFITKPMDYPKLRAILKAAESDIEMRQTSRQLTSQLERGSGFGEFVGTSKAMREVYDLISEPELERRVGHHHRRKRNRQRTRGAHDSPAEQARGRAIHRRQLRRDSGNPDRKRGLRPRKGRIHRRHRHAAGMFRTRQRRHAVPR